MIKTIKILLTAIFMLYNSSFINAKEVDNDMVIAQMNSCVNILTNIINNKSMTVLEHETDQLLNNLTMEHIVGLREIADFRRDLIEEIGRLSINEEERRLLRRINNIKSDNLKWQAFNNALNNTMMLTGGGNTHAQLGFQMLVTAARTGLEYKVAKNELEIEELQAMWDLRKSDLEHFINLRKTALGIIFSLYQKYNLKESDRLTEHSSMQFYHITTEVDANKMIRLLKDNESKYKHLADYYYYLGMGYIDTKNFPEAQKAFTQYERLYAKAPIYRINEKLGLIALTRIAYSPTRPTPFIEKDIVLALSNLPNNDMAIVQCAAVYASVMHNPTKALSVLREGLDNELIEDKSAILAAASFILPQIDSKNPVYKDFMSAYNNLPIIDLDAAIDICLATKGNLFSFVRQTISFKDATSRRFFFGEYKIEKKFDICLLQKYVLNPQGVNVYVESHNKKDVELTRFLLHTKHAVRLKDINDVSCFKENSDLKFLFFTEIGNDEYVMKPNINYNAVLNEPTYLQLQQFPNIEDKEKKSIVKFLKKNERKSVENIYIAEKYVSSKDKVVNAIRWYYDPTYGWNNSIAKEILKTVTHYDGQKNSSYVRFLFNDTRKLELCFKLNNNDGSLFLCYYKINGKRVFANKTILKEFGAKSTNGSLTTNKITKKKTNRPWWKFWGDDSDDKKVEKTATSKTSETKKEDKPWWKFWGDDSDDKKVESTPT